MFCEKPSYGWERDNRSPTNREIVEAFSSSSDLKIHCIINTADREAIIAASSCKGAAILAQFDGHLDYARLGYCSHKELELRTEGAPPEVIDRMKTAVETGEPQIVWPTGYLSDRKQKRSKERLDRMLGRPVL